MEGRISRENLPKKPSVSSTYTSSAGDGTYSAGAAHRPYRPSGSRSYRETRQRTNSRYPEDDSPDGFFVRTLASVILLLFVMFVSLVDTKPTAAIRDTLSDALTQNVTLDDVKDGIASAKAKVVGAKTDKEDTGSDKSKTETTTLSPKNVTDKVTEGAAETPAESTTGDYIDPDILKELESGKEENTPKN